MAGELIVQAFKNVSFSKHLSATQISHLIESGKRISINPGEILFEQGSPGHSMFIILSGEVEIFRKQKCIAKRSTGEYIGEMALLETKPRSAGARAVSKSLLLEINVENFNLVLGVNPNIVWEMIKTLSQRCREELETIDSGFFRLIQCEERYRKIVQSISDIILEVSPDRKIEFANDAVQTLGYDPAELIRQPVEALIETSEENIIWSKLLTKRGGDRITFDVEILMKVNEKSEQYNFFHTAPYLVNASGLWQAQEGSENEMDFMGTLWVARKKKLEIIEW